MNAHGDSERDVRVLLGSPADYTALWLALNAGPDLALRQRRARRSEPV